MYKSFSMELAGRTLTVDVGRVACPGKRCSFNALWRHYCSVYSHSFREAQEGIDFFPLSVEYNERLYSVGKIPEDLTSVRARHLKMLS